MEEDAAVRFRHHADSFGEARSVEIERLAVQRPVLLRDIEVADAREELAAVGSFTVEVVEQRQPPMREAGLRGRVRCTLRLRAQIENRLDAVRARGLPAVQR